MTQARNLKDGLVDQFRSRRFEVNHDLAHGLIRIPAVAPQPILRHTIGDIDLGLGLKFKVQDESLGCQQNQGIRPDRFYG